MVPIRSAAVIVCLALSVVAADEEKEGPVSTLNFDETPRAQTITFRALSFEAPGAWEVEVTEEAVKLSREGAKFAGAITPYKLNKMQRIIKPEAMLMKPKAYLKTLKKESKRDTLEILRDETRSIGGFTIRTLVAGDDAFWSRHDTVMDLEEKVFYYVAFSSPSEFLDEASQGAEAIIESLERSGG